MGILAMGAGASEGMEALLTRLLNEQKVAQSQQQINESGRHNLATEGQASRALDINDAFRRDNMATTAQTRADTNATTQRNNQNADLEKKAGLQRQVIAMRPIGSNVTPEEAAADKEIGVSRGSYGDFNPGDITGQDLQMGGTKPQTPTGMQWRGTQDQITAAANAAKPKAEGADNIEETPDGLVRILPNGKVEPVLDAGGKQVKKFHAPPAPAISVVQSDQGPQVVDRRTGTGKSIIGENKEPLGSMPTSQERNASASYRKIKPIVSKINELSAKINISQGLMATAAGTAGKAAAKLNYDDDIAEYTSLVEAFTPLVARAMGHVGVLTEPDVQSAKAMFPKPTESKSLRDRKAITLAQLFEGIEEASMPHSRSGDSGAEKSGDGVPTVGGTFNGGKVLKVTPIQ